jgi:hypothetical protein
MKPELLRDLRELTTIVGRSERTAASFLISEPAVSTPVSR